MEDEILVTNDDGDVMDIEDKQVDDQEEASASKPQTSLSKSFAIRTRHDATFTGGKVTHCYTTGLETTGDDDAERRPFLVLPVGGDLAFVDAKRGTSLGSVRGLANGTVGEDDNDQVDMDAITVHALSYNDQILMTCSHNNIIRQYSVEKLPSKEGENKVASVVSLTKNWGKSGHALPTTLMQFHLSNVFLATGSVDGTSRIWDVRGGYMTHVFRPYESVDGGGSGRLSVTAVEWLPNLQNLVVAVGRDDGSIAIHNLRHDNQVTLLHEHVSAVVGIQWPLNHDKVKLFVTTGRDSVINLWRMEDNGKLKQSDKKVQKKKKSRNSKNERTGGYSRIQTLPIYEPVEGLVILPPTTPSQQELLVATAGGKGRVRVWKCDASMTDPKLELLEEQPVNQSFSEERGGYLTMIYRGPHKLVESMRMVDEQLIVADAEHNLHFLSLLGRHDLTTKQAELLSSKSRTMVGHNDDILDLKAIPSGAEGVLAERIVVATNSSQVRIFDLASFSSHVLDGHSKTVLCVDVSPCGRFLATCGKDKEMRLWHADSMQCVAIAVGHAEAVGSVALSRQVGRYNVKGKAAINGGGSFAVTVSADRTLKRWNLPGAQPLVEAASTEEELSLKSLVSARAHEKDINVVSVAPNDSLVATGSQDKTIKIWNSSDLRLKGTLSGHRRGVWDCQFSPFDRVLASAGGDKTVKLWSLSDFSCVRNFQGHLSSVLRVRFLNCGMQLASSGADGLIKVYTIRTNECETTLDAHDDKAWALDLSSDGRTIISGGADSRILVWEDTTQQVAEIENAKREEALMLEQKLANHLRHKEYYEALELTLELDKPRQALKAFTAIIESSVEGGKDGIEPLKDIARRWSDERLTKVLQYCREWNTRSRNCHVALLVVRSIVSTIPIHKLADIEGVPEIMAGIMSYSERHFERLDRLYESSFLIEFVLGSMGTFGSNRSRDPDDFAAWEASSKLVLPPVGVDGRIQIGGRAVVGASSANVQKSMEEENDSDDVPIIGDSSDDESDSGSSSSEGSSRENSIK
mmetsp:Transcript_5657/g.11742  ORF Transcript_5657/g.11742 Transcript_5657/m.11742 type:complete len:1031 (+) Transcript_5657:13-3105(+)